MLEFALRYASLGWAIFPLHSIRFDGKCDCGKEACQSPGKHPRIKWSTGASCDPDTVRGYWTRWPNAGIGCATGPSGLLVADADGPKGVAAFGGLGISSAAKWTARARTARGVHIFFRGEGRTRSNPETKLDTRGAGGYVVLAPSPHVSGHVYRWEVEPWGVIAEAPAELVAYSSGGRERRRGTPDGVAGGSPGVMVAAPWAAGVTAPTTPDFTTRLGACLVDWHEVNRALASIDPDVGRDEWIRVGMALHAAGDNGDRWDRWSSHGSKYREGEPAYKWTTFKTPVELGTDGIGLGSLFVIAKGYGYERGYNSDEIAGELSPPTIEENTEHAPIIRKVNGHNVLIESVHPSTPFDTLRHPSTPFDTLRQALRRSGAKRVTIQL